jgi:hypothetical protein
MNAAAAAKAINSQPLNVANKILGTLTSAPSIATEYIASSPAASYTMTMLYYLVLFLFIAFLLAVIIHFTITPIFRFKPGDKGLIQVPSASDRFLYWNDKAQPPSIQLMPPEGDKGGKYMFENNFTVSIDILVRRLGQTTQKNRLVLVKANRAKPSNWLTVEPETDLQAYMSDKASMIVYFDTNNDLNVCAYIGPEGIPANSKPIKNIPLYKPFRLTIVVEERLFTVYLDGQHVFQRAVASGIFRNGKDIGIDMTKSEQGFYAPPFWPGEAEQRSIYHQNLMLWQRPIFAPEVREASPALALESHFDLLPEQDDQKC